MDEKTIWEYIENQKWDEDAESFHLNYAHPYDLTPTRVSLAARRVAVGC